MAVVRKGTPETGRGFDIKSCGTSLNTAWDEERRRGRNRRESLQAARKGAARPYSTSNPLQQDSLGVKSSSELGSGQ